MTDNIASSTTQQPQQNRMLIIHLGNDGVYFDTTVLLPSLITIPTQPQESLSYVQHKLSFPTLTMAVNHIVDEQKKSNGTSSSSYNTIHIILNLQELRTVWTNNMDLALLPLQSNNNNNNNNNTPHSMGNNSSSKLFVHTIQEQSADKNAKGDRSCTQMIHTSFLLAGLQCISEQKIECDTACSVPSSSGGVVIVRTMTAQKIVSSILSSSSASSSLLKAVPIPIQPAKVPTAAVTISLDDDANNNIDSTISNQNDDLIDEDDLLQDEGLYNVAPPTMLSQLPVNGNNKDDCGGRTACDDCTCGRKEQEAGLNDTTNTASTTRKPVTSSACGKCGMGDAFRCASCPYLGKPAFKPGQEHLVLDLQDDL